MTAMTSKGFLVDANGQVLKATAKALDIVTGVDGLAALSAAQLVAKESMATRVTPETFGAVFDGTTDDSAAINAAITATAAAGQILVLPAGKTAYCASSIILKAGARISGYGATLLRACSTTGAFGFICGDINNKVNDVVVEGLTIRGIDSSTYSGNVFAIYGDRTNLRDIRIDTYGGTKGGRAVYWRGDYGSIVNMVAINPRQQAGVGGIRIAGGKYNFVSNCYVESGDDCYQFVPAASDNYSISDSIYVGCRGGSYGGRLMIVALIDPSSGNTTADFVQPAVGATVQIQNTSTNRYQAGDPMVVRDDVTGVGGSYVVVSPDSLLTTTIRNPGGVGNSDPGTVIPNGSRITKGTDGGIGSGTMSASVKRCSFIGIKGFTNSPTTGGLVIRNSDSSGAIDDITVRECSIDATGSTGLYQVYIEGYQWGNYAADNITIEDLRITGTPQTAVKTLASETFGYIKNVHIKQLRSDKGAAVGQVMQLFGLRDSSVRDSALWANGSHGIDIGGTGAKCDGLTIDNVTVRDIGDAFGGLHLIASDSVTMRGNRYVRLAGATDARGVVVSAGANTNWQSSAGNYSAVDKTVVASAGGEGTLSDLNIAQGVAVAANMTLSQGRTVDGNCVFDMFANAAANTAYSLRITRLAGANGTAYVDTAGTGEFQVRNAGVTSLKVQSGGTVVTTSDLSVATSTAAAVNLTMGKSRSVDGNCVFDMFADASANTTYSMRLTRLSGTNGTGYVDVGGTGEFQVRNGNTANLKVQSGGNVVVPNGYFVFGSTNLKNAANDTAAASAGVPLNGLYRNGNAVQQRLV